MEEKRGRKRVIFQLYAPGTAKVSVAGNFNNWDMQSLPLKPAAGKEAGMWQRIMYLEPGEYQYRFIVDDTWWDDPRCEEMIGNEHGSSNAVLRVPAGDPSGGKKKSGR